MSRRRRLGTAQRSARTRGADIRIRMARPGAHERARPAMMLFGVTNQRRWAIVDLLFVDSLINYFDRATISFALPLLSKELHLGPEAKGVLQSAFFWSYGLMQIPMGSLADRVN